MKAVAGRTELQPCLYRVSLILTHGASPVGTAPSVAATPAASFIVPYPGRNLPCPATAGKSLGIIYVTLIGNLCCCLSNDSDG